MLAFPGMVAALVAVLPLPQYSDDEAAALAARAEQLMADISKGEAKRPAGLPATLAALKIDARRIRGRYTHVGGYTSSDEYRLNENYILWYSYTAWGARDGGRFQGVVIRKREGK